MVTDCSARCDNRGYRVLKRGYETPKTTETWWTIHYATYDSMEERTFVTFERGKSGRKSSSISIDSRRFSHGDYNLTLDNDNGRFNRDRRESVTTDWKPRVIDFVIVGCLDRQFSSVNSRHVWLKSRRRQLLTGECRSVFATASWIVRHSCKVARAPAWARVGAKGWS